MATPPTATERLEKMILRLAATPDDARGFRRLGERITADPDWVGLLRIAEANVRRLRHSVELLLDDGDPRPCVRCRQPVTGRADRVYCSDRCRQAAYQSRRKRTSDPSRLPPSRRGAAP
jgi:hypothetical protein